VQTGSSEISGAETQPFRVEIADGVCVVTFDRAPVNAFALRTYEALSELIDTIEADDEIRVVVLTAPESARCWCGGADLRDFVGMDPLRRKERYAVINGVIPRFYALEKPVIASITSRVIGIGVLLAAACDIRISADDAVFSCPEIDYGLVAGSSKLLNYLGLPEALVREMAFTGRPISAQRMLAGGFLNQVVPRGDVLAASLAMATDIAAKSMPALRARKRAFVAHESLAWQDAYKLAQGFSAELVALRDSGEGVTAFLEGRSATVSDG